MARKLVRPGDVFTIPVDAESCGFGHALLVNTQGYNLYIAVHQTLHRVDALPDPSFIASDDVTLIGGTMDALLHHKRWHVVGNVPVNTAQYPWPSFVVRIGGSDMLEAFDRTTIRAASNDDLARFDNRWSRAPIAFQNAFAALHGAANWNEHFDRLTIDHAKRTTLPAA